MKIQLDWSNRQVSELIIINPFKKNDATLKCQTMMKQSGKIIDTKMSSESFLAIQQMIKSGFSQQQIAQEIYKKLKVSSLGETMTVKDILKGGGGCGSSSFRQANDTAIIEKQMKQTQNRNKSSALAIMKPDVLQLCEEMDKIIQISEDDIYNGKTYLLDTIFPMMNKFGVIANRALHPRLLKIIMKGLNLLLRVNVKSEDDGETLEGGLIWTLVDKKGMEEALNNILQRIKARQQQEPLLIHCFCISMIRDMLNTQKNSFDPMIEAIKLGVPLFGLIRNQDPTLLLMVAVKAAQLFMENLTENTMQCMIKYQAKALALIPTQHSENESKNARLLFAYQSALEGIIGKKKSESWEVQLFAMMQINEVLKQMLIDKEQISDSSDKWSQFFNDNEIGLISICKQQSSLRGIVFTELLDTYLLNHKTIRFMAVEIIIHIFKLLNLQGEKNRHKQTVLKQIIDLLFQRWILETAPQVRALFLEEDVLIVINERVLSQNEKIVKSNKYQSNQQADDKQSETTNELDDAIKKEKEALEHLKTQQKGKTQETEIQIELKNIGDTLDCLSSEDGIKKVIKLRQIEQWKTSILNRRAKGDVQKDDALLDTVGCYVGQCIKKKVFDKGYISEGDEKDHQEGQEEEESIEEMEALEYLLNLIKEKKEKNKMCVMVGSGGRGKSMLLKKVELDLLEDFSKGNGSSKYDTLPIIIKMFELDPENPNILEHLQNQPIFKEQRLDPSVLKSSNQQKVLLLDAFDEYRGPEFNIWDTLMLEEWVNTTVVVTCRDDSLTQNSCNRIFSTPHSTKNKPSFTIHELMGFGAEQLESFAQSLLKDKSHIELFQDMIHGNDLLVRLLSLPINALIFIRTIPSLTKSSAQTLNLTNQGELQQLFCSYAFEREAQMIFSNASEISLIPQVIQEYFGLFQRIAVTMFQRKSSELTQEDLNKAKYFTLKPSLKKKLSAAQSDALSAALKKYSNGSILVFDEDKQTVRFVHMSIFEFFVARAIVADFESIPSKSLHELSLEQIQSLAISSRYIVERGDSSGLAILQKIARMIKPTIISADFLRQIQSPSLPDHPNYTQLILLSRQAHFGKQIDTAASNMLSILAYTKCSLQGLNLSKCSLSKAYLYGYQGGIDLTGADLNEAMLAGCGLDLSRSKTEKAQLHEAQSIWRSSDIYSFSSCCFVSNSKPGQLTLATGSITGFFNLFQIDLNFKQQPEQSANLSFDSQFSWKLIKSKRLYSGKILNIKQINNTFILSQKGNILQLDGNCDTILFTFIAHTTDIVSLNCHMSLKHLVTVGQQGEIKIWNIADSFKHINTFENIHSKKVNFAQFSSSEPYYLVSASEDKTCGVWEYSPDKKNWNFSYFVTGIDSLVKRVEFTGTGSSQMLLTCTDKFDCFALWRLQKDKAELVKKLSFMVPFWSALSVSPNGKILVAAKTGRIQVFGDMTDENCQNIHSLEVSSSNYVRDISFSTDSKFIAIAAYDCTCAIRSVENDYQEITIVSTHSDEILNLACTQSSSILVTVSNKGCFFWVRSADANSTSYIVAGRVKLSDEENQFYKVSISDPIGNGEKQYLALSTKTSPTIQIYEIGLKKQILSVELLKSLQIPENLHTKSLRFYGNVLFVAHEDGCIAWDSQDQFKVIFEIKAQKQVFSAALRKQNGVFFPILATKDNSLEVWQFENGSLAECIKKISLGDAQFDAIALASSPDNKYLAAISSDSNCKIFFMLKDFSLVATLKSAQKETFKSITFSADSLRLATTSQERAIKIWSVTSNFEQERAITEDVTIADTNLGPTLFQPDDSKKLITLKDQHIVLWDFQSTYPTDSSIKGHQGSIQAFACSPSGQCIVTASVDYSCKVWMCSQPLNSGESNFEHFCTFQMVSPKKYDMNSISFISESSFVGGCSDKVSRIFQIVGSNVNLVQTLTGHIQQICSVHSAETPSKKQYIASCSQENSCIVYVSQNEQAARNSPSNYKILKTIQEASKLFVLVVAFSPQAKYFAVGSNTGQISLYDSSNESFNLITTLQNEQHHFFVSSLCFSPDNLTLACGYFEKNCLIWDIQTKSIRQELKGFTKEVSCVNYSKDGSHQLALSTYDTFLRIYKQTSEGLQISETQPREHSDIIYSAKFLGSTGILATISKDKTCKISQTNSLFQTTFKQQLASPHSKPITNIAFSQDGKCIAMASEDKSCSLWKITENNKLEHCQTFQLSANSLSIFKDQTNNSSVKLLTISDDKTVRLYQAQSINESANEISKLILPSKPISKFALQSSNNTHSLVLLQSGNCVILNHSGENLSIQQTFNDIKLAAANSTSNFFALLKTDGLQILDKSLNILQTIPLVVSQPQNNYVSLTFSTDDRFIVLTDSYQNITLFSGIAPYEQIQTANKYPMAILASNMANRSQENSYQILSTCFDQNQTSPGLLHTDLIAFLPDKSCFRLKASKEASFTIVADKQNVTYYIPNNIHNIQTL